MVLTYSGQQAVRERERRLEDALQVANQSDYADSQDGSDRSALRTYLHGLGQRLKEKGRRYYRRSDRWLTERLACLGYTKSQARRVLAQASPQLMEEQPGQRVSFIHRLVDRVYRRHEQLEQPLHIPVQKGGAGEPKPPRSTASQPTPETPAMAQGPPQGLLQGLLQIQEALDPRIARGRQRRIKMALEAFKTSDFKGYKGHALREYRKELARKIQVHGPEITEDKLGIATDQDIAIRLYGAGFTKKQIRTAIIRSSPQVGGQTEETGAAYVHEHIDPALLHPKVRYGQSQTWQQKDERGQMYERRLDRLGLATELSSSPEIPRHQQRKPRR